MPKSTIVEYFKDHASSECGYCKQQNSFLSRGMWAHTMTVEDYQALIDRGWRRSGKYCYKPTMNETCCPQYTIKCAVLDFHLSKSHKKVIKKVNRLATQGMEEAMASNEDYDATGNSSDLRGESELMPARDMDKVSDEVSLKTEEETSGEIDTEAGPSRSVPSQSSTEEPSQSPTEEPSKSPTEEPSKSSTEEPSKSPTEEPSKSSTEEPSKSPTEDNSMEVDTPTTEPIVENETGGDAKKELIKKEPKKGVGADPTKPKAKKAKELRKERWRQKHGVTDMDGPQVKKPTKTQELPKSLESFLEDVAKDAKHKLEVRLVRSAPCSEEFNDTFDESYQVYHKYQMKIHGDPPEKPSRRQYRNFLVESPLQVRLCRSSPPSELFEASFEESFELYRKYQMSIHKDQPEDCDRRSFTNFLVHSPLQPYYREGGLPEGYGSFHQHYLIDGKIVAVGVVDVLPSSVSSVYLYYDPDYFFLSLGTYTALREVAFTRYLHTMEPTIQYYYMGFYIHSCPKMKYKGQYIPSFLLCPESYRWLPIEECRPKLDAKKYSRLDDTGKEDPHKSLDLGRILVLHQRQAMPYQFYRVLNPDEGDEEEEVNQYAALVGSECAQRILLYRS